MGLPGLLALACAGSPTGGPVDGGKDVAEVVGREAVGERRGGELVELRVADLVPADIGWTLPCEEPGSLGCSCVGGGDCHSGWCVMHLGERVCSQTCVEECPIGFACNEMPGPDGVPAFVCTSLHPSLCLPCTGSEQCAGFGGGKCVSHGPEVGSFCGSVCGEGTACPPGYECREAEVVEGLTLEQCVLLAGECGCSAPAVAGQLQTACSQSNEHGLCGGWRACAASGLTSCSAPTPMAELCDGVDNDCNGLTDDGNLCNDGNDCTEDSCAGTAGCQHQPTTGNVCVDNDACTYEDQCQAGVCLGVPVVCDDSNPCTDDSCLSDAGCLFQPNSEPCEDDANPCTEDLCVAGKCAHPAGSEGTVCADDGAPCTEDLCTAGACLKVAGNNGAACEDDGDPCTADICEGGKCSHPAANEGAVCDDDGEPCTMHLCAAGTCMKMAGNDGAVCEDDGDSCTVDLCAEGACTHPPGNNGALCADDGDPCTLDQCSGGQCLHPKGNNGAACDDGQFCTLDDYCLDGLCYGGALNSECYGACGNQKCGYGEDALTCPVDCGPCGDGVCGNHEMGPNGGSCPMDCLPPCGDGKCQGGEGYQSCPIDCGGCGDGLCGLNESPENCLGDCPLACGNGQCEPGEGPTVCPADCLPPCGDGICNWGENPHNCPADSPQPA